MPPTHRAVNDSTHHACDPISVWWKEPLVTSEAAYQHKKMTLLSKGRLSVAVASLYVRCNDVHTYFVCAIARVRREVPREISREARGGSRGSSQMRQSMNWYVRLRDGFLRKSAFQYACKIVLYNLWSYYDSISMELECVCYTLLKKGK